MEFIDLTDIKKQIEIGKEYSIKLTQLYSEVSKYIPTTFLTDFYDGSNNELGFGKFDTKISNLLYAIYQYESLFKIYQSLNQKDKLYPLMLKRLTPKMLQVEEDLKKKYVLYLEALKEFEHKAIHSLSNNK
jgi:hypothetical protein